MIGRDSSAGAEPPGLTSQRHSRHSVAVTDESKSSSTRIDVKESRLMRDNNSRSILDTEIASGYTVASYLADAESQDRRSIADFVFRRFHERYVTPLHRLDSNSKHGFCTMAISCLMVEALESFWQGWPDTRRRGPGAFCSFFARNEAFQTLCGHVDGFYTGVRCGILHQGETTGGWRVHRKGPLFVEQTRTLNATSFHDAVTAALRDYTNQLRVATWEDVIWQKLRKKMTAVCSNCAGPDRAFYFAYGSNMKAERLEKRIQPVRKIGKAKLSGWRLKFDKASKDGSSKANLESDAEGLVCLVLHVDEPLAVPQPICHIVLRKKLTLHVLACIPCRVNRSHTSL